MKTIIIGAGPSGITAGILSKTKNNEVIILEKNNKPLKKLLITGNGKCNYFNDDFNIKHYYSNNLEKLTNLITEENKNKVLEFISNIGITPRIKNGYYYPASNQAYSIYNALLKEAQVKGINLITETEVLNIIKKQNQFVIKTNKEEYIADKLIISTGSKACPKTGSNGQGYKFAENLHHQTNKLYPGLVGLISNDKFIKDLSGVRSEVKVELCTTKTIKTEIGEIQFTDNGISGICIYNLSIHVGRLLQENKVTVKVNFLYDQNIKNFEDFINFFDKKNKKVKQRTITELLEGLLNYKIVNTILKISKVEKKLFWDNLTYNQKKQLYQNLTELNINIIGTKDFEASQVTVGGISLQEINTETFESTIVKNLYFTGEILDVTGDCGGYNLGFAFLSGIIVGSEIND